MLVAQIWIFLVKFVGSVILRLYNMVRPSLEVRWILSDYDFFLHINPSKYLHAGILNQLSLPYQILYLFLINCFYFITGNWWCWQCCSWNANEMWNRSTFAVWLWQSGVGQHEQTFFPSRAGVFFYFSFSILNFAFFWVIPGSCSAAVLKWSVLAHFMQTTFFCIFICKAGIFLVAQRFFSCL